jgi:putative transcriptional regulator
MRKPRTGCLLVARPALIDPNFRHAVILLFRHEEKEGSMGLIVNRPSTIRVSGAVGDVAASNRSDRLWIGGPVQQNSVWLLHSREDVDDRGLEVVPGLFLGGSPSLLRGLMASTGADPAPGVFRVVRGYAGWGEGQLAHEISEGAWRVAEADADLILQTDPEDLWDDVLTRAQISFRLPPDTLRKAKHN